MRILLVCLALHALASYALGAWMLLTLRRSVPPADRPARGPVMLAWALSPLVFGLSLLMVPAGVWEWARNKGVRR